MEEYLQYVKTLRSQMNDVEDQAAKISVEEEMLLTNLRALEKDIDSAKSEIARLKEDTEQMKKTKGEICSNILEKQKKIGLLDSDISKLTQTLELIQQERVGLSAKLSEKRAYYSKVTEDMSATLQKQQVKENVDGQKSKTEGMGKAGTDGNPIMDSLGSGAKKNLITELDSAKAKLDEIIHLKSKVLMENNKMKLTMEGLKCRMNDFKPELKAADATALQEGYNALMSDKAGEIEYLRSMEKQVKKLKEIYHVVKCACGEKYTVAMSM